MRDVAKPRQPLRAARLTSVLTIAGSDSSGGAGIQADLRTFAALGMHGLSAITAVTAQNMTRVANVHRVPTATLQSQLDVLRSGFDIAAVKIGMLGSAAIIATVARFLRDCACPVVVDPVLISSSGVRLLPAAALGRLRAEIIPRADVLTPNVPEAAALLGRPINRDMHAVARDLLALGARTVLLKGGHSNADPVCDYLAGPDKVHVYRHRRVPYGARGTGCTLSAAIAAYLASGMSVPLAVHSAERYLQRNLRAAYFADGGTVRLLGPPRRR